MTVACGIERLGLMLDASLDDLAALRAPSWGTPGELDQCARDLVFERLCDLLAQLWGVLVPVSTNRVSDGRVENVLVASRHRQIAVVLARHLTAVDVFTRHCSSISLFPPTYLLVDRMSNMTTTTERMLRWR